jgi:hypothetical protein
MSVNGQTIKPGDTVEIDGPFNVLGFEKAKGNSKKSNEEGD